MKRGSKGKTRGFGLGGHFRATSHTRLRVHNQYTSTSTLISGEGGAGPSSLLHTTVEQSTKYVDARWM